MLGDCSHFKHELEMSKIENDRLRQENNRLQKEIDLLQRMQEIEPLGPNYDGIQDEDLGNNQNPLNQLQSPEPRFPSQSYHAEVTQLKDKLKQTQSQLQWTQDKLRLNQGNDRLITKDKSTCKDEKSKKACLRLKEKNNGKGCKKSSIQKKCKKTCGFCVDGKSPIRTNRVK